MSHSRGRSSCQIRKCRGLRNVPKRRASAFPIATCSPNFALYTQDTGGGSALGQTGANIGRKDEIRRVQGDMAVDDAGGKEQDQGPQLQETPGLNGVCVF